MARPTRGFTLIEMVVVVAIVGLLAAAAHPVVSLAVRRNDELALRRGLRQLRQAIDDYKRASDEGRVARAADASGYPPNLAALVDGVPDARIPDGSRRLYFLRRLPRDPFADKRLSAEQTWALRSSDAAPGDFTPGRDVFDVASRSERLALDGTLFSQW